MATFRAPALSVALMALVLMWASADMAPDAALLSNKVGDVVSAEYRFPPEIDTLVLPNVVIEMCVGARCVCLCLPQARSSRLKHRWAVVYRPAKPLPGPAPVIVFYHGTTPRARRLGTPIVLISRALTLLAGTGNRKTCVVVKGPYEIPVGCAYSETGTNRKSWSRGVSCILTHRRTRALRAFAFHTGQCEPGQKMGEYHLGYGYLAEDLVRQGFIVVSINANRYTDALLLRRCSVPLLLTHCWVSCDAAESRALAAAPEVRCAHTLSLAIAPFD